MAHDNEIEYKPTYFINPFGMMSDFIDLGLKPTNAKVFARIIEIIHSHHPKTRKKLTAQPITDKELRDAANIKGNSSIPRILVDLCDKGLIEIAERGRGKKPTKIKIIDDRFKPQHLRKS